MNTPKTVTELWPSKWLKAVDLGQGKVVTITDCKIEMLKAFQSTEKEPKLTIGFKGATKRLIATKSQAQAIAQIAGSEEFNKWPGLRVTLFPVRLPTGKMTIGVKAAPPLATNGSQPAPEIQPLDLYAPAEPAPAEEFDF